MERIDPIVRTVANLMAIRGGTGLLTVQGASVYDPETATVQIKTVAVQARILVFDFILKSYGDRMVAGGLVETGDKQVFVKAEDGVPYPTPNKSEIVIDDITYRVAVVKSHNPSGVKPIMYELYARR